MKVKKEINKFFNKLISVSLLSSVIVLVGCGGGSGDTMPPLSEPVDLWTWMSGSNVVNQSGAYGTKGLAAATNVPGARRWSISWVDSNNHLWLFGGGGFDSAGNFGHLNDLWHWDGNSWTWVSGSDNSVQAGTYGTKGVAAAANVPGVRRYSISWTDSNDDLWLFGGYGHDSTGISGELNDLWRWDGNNWTWVSGSNTRLQFGTYGTKGVAAAANVPGARRHSISWRDTNGNLWLFGGLGYSVNNFGSLSDLWRWDGSNWTWVSGSSDVNQIGIYGTKGSSATANVPGARSSSISWTDADGNLCLFGGGGYDSAGNTGSLNDLWCWDGNNWTWVSGSSDVNQIGTYGTKGSPDTANVPGARGRSISWTNSNGSLCLFGGDGFDSGGNIGSLNDLWCWDGSNWTWLSGSNSVNQVGTYGTKGSAASATVPGGRGSSISWTDNNGNLWLFGGFGHDSEGISSNLNDLWRYQR